MSRARTFHVEGRVSGPKPFTIRLSDSATRIRRSAISRGRTNRGPTKRHRDSRPHHFEQHADAPGVIEPLERAHEVNKRPGQDSD